MEAFSLRTTVQRALDIVIAFLGRPGLALAVLALACLSAGLAVLAITSVGGLVVAAVRWLAEVACAGIAVIATGRFTRASSTVGALVVFGARVEVVTLCSDNGQVAATAILVSRLLDTVVGCTGVAVVAVHRIAGYAETRLTEVSVRTRIEVVAGEVRLGQIVALPGGEVATVSSALVAVITLGTCSDAHGLLARVARCADVEVIAGHTVLFRCVCASLSRCAIIHGAGVVIVAIEFSRALTDSLGGALVVGCAGVAVLAGLKRARIILARAVPAADIIGAGVSVIAICTGGAKSRAFSRSDLRSPERILLVSSVLAHLDGLPRRAGELKKHD